MTDWIVSLDPPAAIEDRAELSLNSEIIAVDGSKGINWGESEIHAFLAEAKYGETVADSRVPNRVIEIPLVLGADPHGANPDGDEAEEEEARSQLQAKVALLQRQGGVLMRQRGEGEPLYADIVTATLNVPDVYGEVGGVEPNVILIVTCLPDFYGEEITLPAVSGLGQILTIVGEDIPDVLESLPTLDSFKRGPEDPLEKGPGGAEYNNVATAENRGEITSEEGEEGPIEGWQAVDSSSAAVWNIGFEGNVAVGVTVASGLTEGHYGLVALYEAEPESGQIAYGYEMRVSVSGLLTYRVELVLRKSGGEEILAEANSVKLPFSVLALTVFEGKVQAWRETEHGWESVVTAYDSTYSGLAHVGVAGGDGMNALLTTFSAGVIPSPVIQGDYPARTRLIFTDESGANQRGLLWGLRSTYFSSERTADLFYNAAAMTCINGAALEEVSGGYATDAVILAHPIVENWHPFLETTLAPSPMLAAVADTLAGADEEPLDQDGEWAAITGAANTGAIESKTWVPSAFGTESGARWTEKELTDPVVGLTMVSSPEEERYFGVWACLSATAKSGYCVRAIEGAAPKFTVTIERWVAGTKTTLASIDNTKTEMGAGAQLKISVISGVVTAWVNDVEVGSVEDGLYTQGYAGIMGSGDLGKYIDFALGEGGENLSHVGNYRIWARVQGESSEARLRFAWSNDDATAPIYNTPVALPSIDAWYMLDLGEISIPEVPVGERWWKGIFQVNTGGSSKAMIVDSIWLQPLDDGAGRLRATAIPSSSSLRQQAVNVPAVENDSGIKAGTAWDNDILGWWTVGLSGLSGSSEALLVNDFGFDIPTGATVHGFEFSAFTTKNGPLYGGVGAQIAQGSTLGEGLGNVEVPGALLGSPSFLGGLTWTPAQVNADLGLVFSAYTVSLLSGEDNFWVWTAGITATCYFSFSTTALPVDAVLYAERSTEVQWQGAYREDPHSGAYARISEETGALPRLPPSGLEQRPVQLLAKQSRGLLPSATPPAQEADTDGNEDLIVAQVAYRPCWIGRI